MIRFHLQPGFSGQRSAYALAGQTMSADLRFEPLEPFRIESLPGPGPTRPAFEPPPQGDPQDHELIHRGQGWLGERWRAVEAWSGADGMLLRVEGADAYRLLAGGEIVRLPTALDRPLEGEAARLAVEIAFGPALLLQLARRGTFALHASAARIGEQTIAFAGASGAGKSTLAASLAGSQPWRRIADDVLPIRWGDEPPSAYPHFPQLKLPAADQYRASEPSALPLATITLLTPTDSGPPQLQPLPRREATLALVKHTIAAKLFTPPLQAELLDALSQATTHLPVYRLTYPHTPEASHQISNLLQPLLAP